MELVNDHILNEVRELRYTCFQEVFRLVIKAGHYYSIFKKDVKDAFRIVLVAS